MAGAVIGAVAGPVISSVVGGVLGGGSGSSESTAGTQQAAAAADPFASQRAQYQTQLAALMADPSSVTQTPGYQFNLQQGLGALNASMAATGQSNSGARQAAVESYGAGLASNTYQQQLSNLMTLSGANINGTGQASSILSNANTANTNAANTTIGGISSGLTSGLSNYMSAGNGLSDFMGL